MQSLMIIRDWFRVSGFVFVASYNLKPTRNPKPETENQ